MSWTIRAAAETDRAALRRFECDSGDDCPSCGDAGENLHEREVQEYVRRFALDEAARRSPHNDHTLLVLEDQSGGIAGVIGFEKSELMDNGQEVDALSLWVAALRLDVRGQVVAGYRLSSHLLAAAVRGYQSQPPLVVGCVATCNARSRALLRRHLISSELAQSEPNYVDVVGRMDEVVATLPPPLTE
jgi:hypothetical protein